MDGHLDGEMIRSRGRRTKIKDTNVGIGRDAGEDVGRVRRECGRVRAAMCREGEERVWPMW